MSSLVRSRRGITRSSHSAAFACVTCSSVTLPSERRAASVTSRRRLASTGSASASAASGARIRPGQVGGLGQAELTHVLAEVGPRRRPDAVGAAAEVDRVEVPPEDLLLVELALELHGQHRLLHLPGDAALGGQVDVLHVLLGDRGTALLHAAAADVVVERAGDAHRVHAAVLEEVAVLGGEHRVDQDGGDLVERAR